MGANDKVAATFHGAQAQITPSEWGFTARLPNGTSIAHSHSRPLLEEYLRDALGGREEEAPGPEPVVVGGVPASGDDLPRSGACPGGSGGLDRTADGGVALTEITYTTRARSTGATCSAGRTATGWGVLCASHGESRAAKNRSEAETVVSKPQEWCSRCALISAGVEPKIAKNSLLEDLL